MSKEISVEELQALIASDIEDSNVEIETVEEKRRDLGLPPIFTEVSASLYGLNEYDKNYSEELSSEIANMDKILRRHEEIRLIRNNSEGLISGSVIEQLTDGFEINDFELTNLVTSYPSSRNYKLLPKISNLIGVDGLKESAILQEVTKNSVYFITAIEELLTELVDTNPDGSCKLERIVYLADTLKNRPGVIMDQDGTVFNVYTATVEQVKEFCSKNELTTPEMTLLFELLDSTGNTHVPISGVLGNIVKMYHDLEHNTRVIKASLHAYPDSHEGITYFTNRMALISNIQDYMVLHKLFIGNDICSLVSVVFNDQF